MLGGLVERRAVRWIHHERRRLLRVILAPTGAAVAVFLAPLFQLFLPGVIHVVRVASEALERRVELVWGAMACGAVSEKYDFGLEPLKPLEAKRMQ